MFVQFRPPGTASDGFDFRDLQKKPLRDPADARWIFYVGVVAALVGPEVIEEVDA